ncbi:beta-1-syntrophin-like [Octopus sinensis]|uniref:Beta-1-syntrophin-like n=1 Tax=Octopus sinensis TaxID=2607531 RepID=A0A6P7TY46_9MOLL|nr:beta-1-syntrophin-like [Octopus sinensis]XP_029656688.1 beta-1-syntrophin-like [Octopus sinensis]XP_029656694.1 beta-1-syntrophin-like [Octopus sinensis]
MTCLKSKVIVSAFPKSTISYAELHDSTLSLQWTCKKSRPIIRKIYAIPDKFYGLGIVVKGGSKSNFPLIVTQIFKNSVFAKKGELQVGDVILSVNGNNIEDSIHSDAVSCIKACKTFVIIDVMSIRYLNWEKRNRAFNVLFWNLSQFPVAKNNEFSISLSGCRVIDHHDNVLVIESSQSKKNLTIKFPFAIVCTKWVHGIIFESSKTQLYNKICSIESSKNQLSHNSSIYILTWLYMKVATPAGVVKKPVSFVVTDKNVYVNDNIHKIEDLSNEITNCNSVINCRYIHNYKFSLTSKRSSSLCIVMKQASILGIKRTELLAIDANEKKQIISGFIKAVTGAINMEYSYCWGRFIGYIHE